VQISKNARFWDSDVPYGIGSWWGFWVMLGELGVKGKGFCSTKLQISMFSLYWTCSGSDSCWWGDIGLGCAQSRQGAKKRTLVVGWCGIVSSNAQVRVWVREKKMGKGR
jgi:hypothetical protein